MRFSDLVGNCADRQLNGNKTIFGIIIIAFVTLVVFGGIKRIAAVMEKTVPFMAIIYLLGVLVILVMNYDQILPSLGNIIKYAFTSHAAFGGFTGSTIALAMRWGIARGVYSNEAGYGTAAIAHSASDVDHPIRQAVWGVFEVGVDTLLVCTATALAVLTTGVWTQEGIDSGALGQAAFGTAFGRFGEIFVAVCVVSRADHYNRSNLLRRKEHAVRVQDCKSRNHLEMRDTGGHGIRPLRNGAYHSISVHRLLRRS